ncbi:L,D-transpeptidase [Aliarcobacter cibarius]|uniref:Putative lipoprotein-anchoring transpeptidase, ErfK/SrfK family n=1 Tax=Aliarcobacter cibarius TaxID=255507 RepID=A0A7L5JRS0_9BACT|nr:L,D-transpeptidase [Aliarcobacter cibarius]QKJ27806.1 putative lipoprotein-anchoring transpeptidase, ErfK/SrfK family [Aliarcobacter cibarius]
MRKIFILLMMVNYFLYSNEEFPIVSTMPPYEELEFVSYDYFPKSKEKVEKNNQKKQDIKNINNKEKVQTKVQEQIMNNEPINIPKVEKEKPIINKVETKKVEEVKTNIKEKEADTQLIYLETKKELVEDEDRVTSNIEEELRDISFKEFDENEEKNKDSTALLKALNMGNSKDYEISNKSLQDYEELIIEVDSNKNVMKLKSKFGKNTKELKTYNVSTAKNGVKKPLGEGRISSISLNPVWYPTNDTRKSFEKKGIILPNVVPPNHKYNYMGAAKLNLTHIVDGNQTYRIHGTLNEKSIGSKESAGCIRMRNSDVLELAKIVQDFFETKGPSKVKVILL